jgi:hypothetical protein
METGVMTDETKEDKQNKNHTWKWETQTDATTDGKKVQKRWINKKASWRTKVTGNSTFCLCAERQTTY